MSNITTSLSYYASKSEFTLGLKNASKATYTIEYQAKKDKEVVTEALTGQLTGKGTLSATHFAGTESGGAKVPHVVTGGSLKATVTGLDNTQSEITRVFTITEQGQLKIVSESAETSAAGSVLGASTDDMSAPFATAAALAVPRPVATPAPMTAQEQARSRTTETTVDETDTLGVDIPVLPLAIGGGLLLLAGLGFLLWSLSRKKTPTTSSTSPMSPPQTLTPTPTVPQNDTMPQA